MHLEFRMEWDKIIPPMPEDAETVLILAGDINLGNNAVESCIKPASERFRHVLYVLGNHEFYYHDILFVARSVRDAIEEEGLGNITLLDNNTTVIDGVRFIGTTLWTDLDNRNPLMMVRAEQNMNDYELILFGGEKLRAPDTINLFDTNVRFLREEIAKEHSGATIIVTHHLPTHAVVHPMFRGNPLNGAYASKLDDLVLDCGAEYWFHGHSHQTMPLDVGQTKLRQNPFGYGRTENLKFDPFFRVEI